MNFVEHKLEMMVLLEDGWEFTGEFRCPKKGEYFAYFLTLCGIKRMLQFTSELTDHDYTSPRYIIRKAKWIPKANENYFIVDMYGVLEYKRINGKDDAYKAMVIFKTRELAEKAFEALKNMPNQ